VIMGNNSEKKCEPDASLVDCLKNATVFANLAIHHKSQEDSRCAGMGATFTGAAVHGDLLDLVQVGDSRGYLIRKSQIRLATKDQSLVQQLVDVGQISEAEAETHMFRNVILQALGAQGDVTPVTGRIRLRRGDTLLLCSDGLSGKLRSEDIQNIVAANQDLAKACDELVAEANNRGGEDNITVILARFTGDELEDPTTDKITVELPPMSEEDKTLDDTYNSDTEPQ
jgi:serine/threonine protein phosphatase PrpC